MELPTKLGDRTVALFILGAVSLFPPMPHLFTGGLTLGVPRIVVYIFGVWIAIVIVAFLISRTVAGTSD